MIYVKFDVDELEDVIELLARRAELMVPEAVAEAHLRANDVAARGRRRNVSASYLRVRRRVLRARAAASGAQIADWVERVMYRRFVDFFGSW